MYSEALKTKTEAIEVAQKFSNKEENGHYAAIILNSRNEDYFVRGNDAEPLRQNEIIISQYMNGKYVK